MTRNRKHHGLSPSICFLIFTLLGIGMLIGGFVFMARSYQFRETAVEVSGTVTEISSRRDSDGDLHYSVRVSYSYNGQDYVDVPLDFYSSNMYEGKDIALLVDPEAPGHMTSKSGDAFTYIIFLVMGGIFAAVGIVPLVLSLASSLKGKKLQETGRQLHATVERIDLNTSVTYNGRHPYIVFCTYQDMGTDVTYRFRSKNLIQDPGYAPGDPIEVFVDPQDYSNYVVVADGPANPRVIDYT